MCIRDRLTHTPDVANCQRLGQASIAVDSVKLEEPMAALQRKAAQEGATHVVPDGSAMNGTLRGEMYKCEIDHEYHSGNAERFVAY